MKVLDVGGDAISIEFSREEFFTIRSALVEVSYGIQIDDSEFSTRMGVEREDASALTDLFCRWWDSHFEPR